MNDPSEHLFPASCNYIFAEFHHEGFAFYLLFHAAVGIESIFQGSGVVNKWIRFPEFK